MYVHAQDGSAMPVSNQNWFGGNVTPNAEL
jgi:hypothetical protein